MADHQIANAQDIIEAVGLCYDQFGDAGLWWRGHSLMEPWPLIPEVFRSRDYLPNFEKNVAINFYLKAKTRHANCPDRRNADEWLFLMQHYGLPTRLLDWTETVLVAVYFAVRDESQFDRDGAIWAIAPEILNQHQTGDRSIHDVDSPPARELFMEAFRGGQEPKGKVLAIGAPEIDLRMMVQRSAFTIHGTRTALEDIPEHEKFLLKFRVPREAKELLKVTLEAFGYSEAFLFPDLEHLAKEMRSQFK